MDKVNNIDIFQIVSDTFKDCTFTSSDNLIWVYRGNVSIHILDFNTLKYFHQTNQLKEYLSKL